MSEIPGIPGFDDAPTPDTGDDALVLSDGWNQLASQVPGSVWRPDERRYVMPRANLSPRTATIILKVLPHVGLEHPDLYDLQSQGLKDIRPVDHSKRLRLTADHPVVDAAMAKQGFDYFDYQRWDIGYLVGVLEAHGAGYCGWQRGMGKTMAGFAIREALGARRTMIVAGNLAKHIVWEDEAKVYLEDGLRVVVLPNVKAKREACLKDLYATRKEPVVFIVHYEALDIIAGKSKGGWEKFGSWDLVIADETHRIKNGQAKVSRALKRVPARRKLALSGSVIENHAEELFSQLQWLFPDRYRSKWRDWNLRYLDYVENGGYGKLFVGVKPEKLQQMQEELGVFMVYRRRRDEIDMPKRTDRTLMVDLSKGQRKAYEDVVTACLTELDDGTIVAGEDGLPMLSKLRQIATGLDLLGNVTDSSKLDLAVELATETEDPVLIFGWWKASLRKLEERLGPGACARIDGDMTQNARIEAARRFNRGDVRVLLGTIPTIGESLNLQRANHAILLDRSWNPMKNAQAEDRVDRLGQTSEITVTHIVARDTVDTLRVTPVLASKEALRRAILGG